MIFNKEALQVIKEAIAQLPDEFKNIITLKDLNELSASFPHSFNMETRKQHTI